MPTELQLHLVLQAPPPGIDFGVSAGKALHTLVPGTHKDGGPNCATIKPFAGWAIGK